MSKPRSLVMACPQQTDKGNHPKAALPSVGIIEIPHGCSIQTDEWILQPSHQFSTVSTRNDSVLLPRLRGVNWDVATGSSDAVTEERGRSENSSLQASLEMSLKQIAGGRAGAHEFGKTVRALEEGDKERRDGVQHLQPYPYKLWGGMLVAFSACGVIIMILWRRGGGRTAEIAELRVRLRTLEDILQSEAGDQRGRRGNKKF